MAHDVIAVGTVNIDMIVIGDAPHDINVLNEWVDLSRVEIMPAGSMGYCAVDMARLGLKVAALSSVGGDLFGEWIVRRLGSEGVDSSGKGQDHRNSDIHVAVRKPETAAYRTARHTRAVARKAHRCAG